MKTLLYIITLILYPNAIMDLNLLSNLYCLYNLINLLKNDIIPNINIVVFSNRLFIKNNSKLSKDGIK